MAEHLLFSHIDIGEPAIAAAGANKWTTTYGALTHLAHGCAIRVCAEAAPTVLAGSSVISVGAGSNHRTLASFLWGEAPFHHASDAIEIIEDEFDPVLWHAPSRRPCRPPRIPSLAPGTMLGVQKTKLPPATA